MAGSFRKANPPIVGPALPGTIATDTGTRKDFGARSDAMRIQTREPTKAIRNAIAVLLLAILASAAVAGTVENTYSIKHRYGKRQPNSDTVTIIASSAGSTYTRFVEDIQNVVDALDPNGLRVLPILGRGGGQNFNDILSMRGVDMGTTDADYLRYFKQKDPVLYSDAEKRIQYITKLFNAEFHVLARKEIRSYSDLAGAKVNFWKPLSVTALAAENIFRLLGIDVIPANFDNDLAIEKLRNGEISAVVRMGGAPQNDYINVTPEDGFHLVPLAEANFPEERITNLMELYIPTALTHEQYPQLIPEGETVPTVASSVVLAVYAWPEDSDDYQRVAEFVKVFFDNIGQFQDPSRHPKWREINLAGTVPGWIRFKPAQQWLDTNKSNLISNDNMKHEFEMFVHQHQTTSGKRGLTSAEEDALFEKFLSWWKGQNRPPRN
jgi:uncharacterized protein